MLHRVFEPHTGLTVAGYEAIKIGLVRMSVGADTDRTFEFSLPRLTARDVPMIVTFLLISSNDLHMRIAINDKVISGRLYANGAERCIQEFANDIPFPAGDRHNMSFTVLQGEVRLSDVVLWFQRNI